MLVIPGWVIPADINSKSLAKAGITVDIIIICFYSCRQDGNSYLTLWLNRKRSIPAWDASFNYN